jgi:hypothetical protein
MNKRAELLDAMLNNPRDWHIDGWRVVATQFGIECRISGGSHHVFDFPVWE